jgi:peptidoglycan hydrolase CwlO-like protein
MADKEKKPSYLIWIMIGIGVLALVLIFGIGFYLLWRKIVSSDIKLSTTAKTVEDLRVSHAKTEAEIKNKDEKIQELVKEMGDLKNENTKLVYQIKELKKASKPIQQTGFQTRSQTRVIGGKKQNCDDGTCTQEAIEDLE